MAAEKELLKGITLMQQGKEEGFNILYTHTYDYVYRRAKFIMKNEEDACDLTQETFIQAYRGIASLQDTANIYAWLGGIVYRQGMRIFRKKKDLLVDEEAESIFTDIASTDKDLSPEQSTEEKATSDVVMEMIEELPELQRAALVAFYYDNMKIEDIAVSFECSANTIKSRLNYAKKSLKEKVEEHEKKYSYRLHSVSPAIILWAFRSLFTKEEYALSATAAKTIYSSACGSVGLTASALNLSGAAAAKGFAAKVTAGIAAAATVVTIGAVAIFGNQGPNSLEEYQEYEGVYYSEGMDYDSFKEITGGNGDGIEQAIAIKIEEVAESDGRIFAQIETSQEMRFDETVPQFVREERGEAFGSSFKGGAKLVEGRVEIPCDLELKLNKDGTITAIWHISLEMSDGTTWKKDMQPLTLYKAGGSDEPCPGWD